MDLSLKNLAALRLDLIGAGMRPNDQTAITVDTDGAVKITLSGARTEVRLDGELLGRAKGGRITVDVPAGHHVIAVG